MSNDNINQNNQNIELYQKDAVKESGLINYGFYNIDTEIITISYNHAINSEIKFTIDKKKWTNNHKILFDELEQYGVRDNETQLLSKKFLNDNEGKINAEYNIGNDNEDPESEKEKVKLREITTFKYSKFGQGDLYESVFINNGLPFFIKYNVVTNSLEQYDKIEEKTRILVPPTFEECPYLRYEFESLDEINSINKFIEDNHIGLDYLYYKCYEIVSKYNNQSKHKLRLVTIKIITSHFQDRFSTTDYLYPVGGNGSGKSSLAETFRAIAYKAVVMTDPTCT